MKHKVNRRLLDHEMTLEHPKKLTKNTALLLIISALYTVSVALSDTFVNVYLWKIEKNYLLIGWFNLIQYLAILIVFIISGKLTKKVDRIVLFRLGVTFLAVFYLMVLLLGNASSEYYILLGLLIGIGEGLFWFSFNILYFEITEPENRDNFNGWNGLFTSSSGIIAPFLAGWFIAHKSGVTGYRIIFFISLAIFFLAAILSFFFYKRKSRGEYRLKEAFQETVKKGDWRNIFFAMIAQGVREGVIIFLVGLLVYISTENEFSLGTYTMIISAVASVTYFLVGKYIKSEWRNTSMMIGTILMAIVVIPMFINTNYTTLLIYGIGTSLFAPLYFIPLTSKTFDVIGRDKKSAELRSEYIVVRETGLNIGRIAITGVFLILIKYFGTEYLQYLLLVSGSSQIFAWYFMKKVR